jgi:fructose-1,6-bisphosphatase/inositol monophosphatase family enzyme
MAWEREIEVCREVSRRAGMLAIQHAVRGVTSEDKSDLSPVTIADRECEKLIVESLHATFPDDGLLGEEGAREEGRSGRRWIVDPIDGTRDFVRGLGTWSNLVALEADGEVVLGVCNMAAQDEMYWAVRGGGAWVNEKRLAVSKIDRRGKALACLTAFDAVGRSHLGPRILDHLAGYWAVRSMGGCQDAMLVASGRAEVWIELTAKAWDLAPIQVIAEEAGARFFNFDGGRSIHGGNCVVCVPFLEPELRAFVREGRRDEPRDDNGSTAPGTLLHG